MSILAGAPFELAQSETHYPRDSSDAVAVLNILKRWFPAELGLAILHHAGYWLRSRVAKQESIRFSESLCHDGTPYLLSEPIKGKRFPAQQVIIDIWSHDQGWSSYPENHGTYRGSWTWFDLGIRRPPGREDIAIDLPPLVTNVHASSETRHHQVVYRRHEQLWMGDLQEGDRISITPRARFPGWVNFTEGAAIEIYTDLF